MTATAIDQITREGDSTVETLWANFDLLWTQYQSWREHDRLLAKSQDRLNMTAPEVAEDLKQLLGDNLDLEIAGQQLSEALSGLTTELDRRQSALSLNQHEKLDHIKMQLSRERELRALSQRREHERDR